MPTSTSRYATAAAIFLIAITLYAVTIPGNRTEAEDACAYAALTDAPTTSWTQLLLPDHVLFFPLIRSFHALRARLGATSPSYDDVVMLDLVVGATAAALLYLLLERLAVGRGPALLGAMLFACSYGAWRYAVEIEIPAWTSLFALAVLFMAFDPRPSGRKSFALGLLAAASILMHGLNALLACTAIPAWLLIRRGIRSLAAYTLGAALLLTTVFGTVFVLRGNLEREIFLGPLSATWTLVPKGMIGLAQAIVAGQFLFGNAVITARMATFFPEKMLQEEIFLGQRGGTVLFALSVATCLALGATVLWTLAARLRVRSAAPRSEQGPFLALWALAYAAFAVHTNPASLEIWIPGLVPFWILVTLYVVRPLFASGHRAPCIAFAAALLLHNLVGGFAWIHDPGSDYNHLRAAWLVDHATDRDLIVTADTAEFSACVDYWSRGTVLNTHAQPDARLLGLTSEIEHWPGTVYVMDSVFDPPPCLCLQRDGFCDEIRAVTNVIRPLTTVATDIPNGAIYALTSPPTDDHDVVAGTRVH